MKDYMTADEIEAEIKYHIEQIRAVFTRRHVAGTDFTHNRYVITQDLISLRALRGKQKYIPYHPESVSKQARLLSSGTMANLTGKTRYDEVDPIQAEFIEFCEETEGRFETWQSAWNEFWKIIS